MAGHLNAVGSSLAGVTCETSQVLLASGQVLFLGDSCFHSKNQLMRLKMSEKILMSCKTQIKKKSYINANVWR